MKVQAQHLENHVTPQSGYVIDFWSLESPEFKPDALQLYQSELSVPLN
jgi:hypothetical protein